MTSQKMTSQKMSSQKMKMNQSMNLRKKQSMNEIHEETTEILAKLDSYLPPGWKLTEGNVRVNNRKYHSWMTTETKKNTRNEEWSIGTVMEEFKEMDHNLPLGWKLRWGAVENKYEEYVIKRGDHGDYFIRKSCTKHCRSRKKYRNREKNRSEYESTKRRVDARLGGRLNLVNYENSNSETEYVNNKIKVDVGNLESEFKKDFLNVVYSGSNIDIDPYKGVVDTGAPRTVAGRIWMEAFSEDSQGVEIPRYKENESYRFGNGPMYTSKEYYAIEVRIGHLRTKLNVSVVEADVPLLLGMIYYCEIRQEIMDFLKRKMRRQPPKAR